jgi:hypothetical protein
MGNRKVIGILLLVAGIVLMFVSLLADRIGIGGTSGFGYKQSIGSVIGGFVTAAGFYLASGNRKLTGILLLVGGVVLLVVSLLADRIGLGVTTGFGYDQIIGAAAGVIAAVVGFVLFSRK